MEARTVSMGIFSHVLINFDFRASILGLELEQASLSRIDHKEKSRGLRSGEGGYSSLLIQAGQLFLHHA